MRRASYLPSLLIVVCGAALLLCACGSRGSAPPLGKAATANLAAQGASASVAATLTPIRAMHVAVYYRGQAVPATGAQTPAQLRRGACDGPIVAGLTDGLPPISNSPTTQVDPKGGMNVAAAPGADSYVAVLDHANDPNAPIVACGHPLSDRRQFFDLYPPAVGSNGIALGTALMEPTVATSISLTLGSLAQGGPATWTVHTGGCAGATLASGLIAQGAQSATATVFATLDPDHWWLTVSPTNGPALCGKVQA
jgi:hypothetical protein